MLLYGYTLQQQPTNFLNILHKPDIAYKHYCTQTRVVLVHFGRHPDICLGTVKSNTWCSLRVTRGVNHPQNIRYVIQFSGNSEKLCSTKVR